MWSLRTHLAHGYSHCALNFWNHAEAIVTRVWMWLLSVRDVCSAAVPNCYRVKARAPLNACRLRCESSISWTARRDVSTALPSKQVTGKWRAVQVEDEVEARSAVVTEINNQMNGLEKNIHTQLQLLDEAFEAEKTARQNAENGIVQDLYNAVAKEAQSRRRVGVDSRPYAYHGGFSFYRPCGSTPSCVTHVVPVRKQLLTRQTRNKSELPCCSPRSGPCAYSEFVRCRRRLPPGAVCIG